MLQSFLSYFVDSVDDIKAASGLQYEYRFSNWSTAINNGAGKMEHGNVILSRYPIIRSDSKIVYGKYIENPNYPEEKDTAWSVLKVELENGAVIVNHHGYWRPNEYGDEMTVECMEKVADFIKNETAPLVMCGDLNIISESPAMRKLDFLRDLTPEYGIKTTLQNLKFVKDVPCDHILVNDKIIVKNYQAHDELISDHKVVSAEIEF